MTVCPRCGRQDTVHKVSELVALGYVPAAPADPQTDGEDHAPAGAASRELAQRLFIPDELWLEIEQKAAVEGAGPGNRTSRSLATLVCALAGFILVNQLDSGWAWLGLLTGMLLGGIFFNYLPNRVLIKARAVGRLARERAQRRYNTLYYCSHDDLVFIPEEDLSAPVEQMIDLLYRC